MPLIPAKKLANGVILSFLTVLLVSPAWYYLGGDDELDERWAWRMFSSVRMTRCRVDWRVGDPPQSVRLHHTFHEAWIGLARRGRQMIIDSMTERLCEDHPGEPVRLLARCQNVGGETVLARGDRDLCEEHR